MTTIIIQNERSFAAKLFLALARKLFSSYDVSIETIAEPVRDIDAEIRRGIEYHHRVRAGLEPAITWEDVVAEIEADAK